METHDNSLVSQLQRKIQSNAKNELVQYVEELADENDYWLSITDASRVCRVQDINIRRAIEKGHLPVRPHTHQLKDQ